MRISDWSSDVCSSDLIGRDQQVRAGQPGLAGLIAQHPPNLFREGEGVAPETGLSHPLGRRHQRKLGRPRDRKSVVEGKSVAVRGTLGGRRILIKKKRKSQIKTDYKYCAQ